MVLGLCTLFPSNLNLCDTFWPLFPKRVLFLCARLFETLRWYCFFVTDRETSLVYGCQGDPANLVTNIRMECTVFTAGIKRRCRVLMLNAKINAYNKAQVIQVADQR